jgi:chromosome segregation ATPase
MTAKAKGPEETSELLAAAQRVDKEMREFEHLVRAATREPLNARRRIQQSAGEMRSAVECAERLGEALRALVGAFEGSAVKTRTLEEELRARSAEVERRAAELDALEARVGALGQQGAAVSTKLREATPGSGPAIAEAVAALGALAEDARKLEADAAEARFGEVQREAQSIAQKVATLAGRLGSAAGKPTAS